MERMLCTVAMLAAAYAASHFGVIHLHGELSSLMDTLNGVS
jgi:hypothetical protein